MNKPLISKRDELVELNIIHEFESDIVIPNLRGCYGKICSLFYEGIIKMIVGSRVLDCGCGFGLFSKMCSDKGLVVHSIDVDEKSLNIARDIYKVECNLESVYQTSLPDDSIDTVILNDVIEHLDLNPLIKEINRIGTSRIIVQDTNTYNPFLRLYRWVTGHKEMNECKPLDIVNFLSENGFKPSEFKYMNIISLYISGGLQRRPIPIFSRYPRAVFMVDSLLNKILGLVGVTKILGARYVAVFDRIDSMH